MKSPVRPLRERRTRAQTSLASRRILERVNREPKSACVVRVLWMLNALRLADELRSRLYEASWNSTDELLDEAETISFRDPKLQSLNLEFRTLIRNIQERLKRYRWTPTIDDFEFAGLQRGSAWSARSDADEWENRAIDYLLMKATSAAGRAPAEIGRLRSCRTCGKWFYAATDHQTNCSTQCRKKFHSESPEAHAKRAEYMRIYRQDQKALEQRAKDMARTRRVGK